MNARRGTLAVTDDGTTGGRGVSILGTASGSIAAPDASGFLRRCHVGR